MKGYRKGSHTVCSLHCHFMFTPNDPMPVPRGDVSLRPNIRPFVMAGDIREQAKPGGEEAAS